MKENVYDNRGYGSDSLPGQSLPKSKTELYRERQQADQQYSTGLQIGGGQNNYGSRRSTPKYEAPLKESQYENNRPAYGVGVRQTPPLPKSKVELNREKQADGNIYTGLNIGGYDDSRSDRSRLAKNYHDMLDQQVALKKDAIDFKKKQDEQFVSGTGIAQGYGMGSPPIHKTKVELNRERQAADNVYTGLQIGGYDDRKNDKSRMAKNYHDMLDQQVALKREEAMIKKRQDEQNTRDILDQQMAMDDRNKSERRMTDENQYNVYMRQQQGGDMNAIMGGGDNYGSQIQDNSAQDDRSAYDKIRNKYGNHSKGYNILTGV